MTEGLFPPELLRRIDFQEIMCAESHKWEIVAKKPPMERSFEDLQELIGYMRGKRIFDDLGLSHESIAQHIVLRSASEGTVMAHADMVGVLCVLVSGSARSDLPLKEPVQLSLGDAFGTLNPDHGRRHALVVATSQPTDFLFLPKAEIQATLLRNNAQLLQRQPLFQHFTTPQLREMCKLCSEKIYQPGSYVIEQGKPCDGMYIIKTGTCVEEKNIHIQKSNRWPSSKTNEWKTRNADTFRKIDTRRIGEGRMVGEIDCPQNKQRTFSLRAVDLVYAIFWSKDFVANLVKTKPKMQQFMMIQEREQLVKEQEVLKMVIGDEAKILAARKAASMHMPEFSPVRYRPPRVKQGHFDLRIRLADPEMQLKRRKLRSKQKRNTGKTQTVSYSKSAPQITNTTVSIKLPKIM